jgi:hypothetical protein
MTTTSGTSRTSCAATASPDAGRPGRAAQRGSPERNFDVSWVTNQDDFHHNQATTAVLVWISLAEAQSLSC